MKERSTSSYTCMGNREIEVCQTLLNFKSLIRKFEILSNLKWGNKKPRSSKLRIPNPNPLRRLGFIYEEIERKEVPSPKSPISLSDSEPDDMPKQPHGKVSKKRTVEELLEKVEKLEQNGEVLRREIEKVRCYRSKLMTSNLELKATKKQLESRQINSQPENQVHLPSTSLHDLSKTMDMGSSGSTKKLRRLVSV